MGPAFSCRIDRNIDLLDVQAALPGRYPYLLDSAARGPLGARSLLLRAGVETLVLDPVEGLQGPGRGGGFLERFDHWYRACAQPADAQGTHAFAGGWFVYLGYELAAEIEPVLRLPPADDGLPVAFAARCDGAILVDHEDPGHVSLVAESGATLEAMRAELAELPVRQSTPPTDSAFVEAEPPDRFEAAIGRIHRYIREGDIFQVNLSRGWRARYEEAVDPFAVYRSLRQHNPAPFAGMMHWRGSSLMSSSPERLVEIRGDLVQTRPIAGTYPRGRDATADLALSRDLLAHPKERAEHIMLIDLERNDLGRVCAAGSVEVNELMVVETYAHVHHMVSNVRGRLVPGRTPADVIRAVFPGGTITGAPKVRCMEIIAELEGRGRGFYTGSMGYIGRDGSMDLNILIRSMLLTGRDAVFRTGAGIVADSVPAREVAETEAKARGLLAALGN